MALPCAMVFLRPKKQRAQKWFLRSRSKARFKQLSVEQVIKQGSKMNQCTKPMRRGCLILVLPFLFLFTGCSEDIVCESDLEQTVTYTADIAPMFEAKCNYCHNHEKTGVEREGADRAVAQATSIIATRCCSTMLLRCHRRPRGAVRR